MTTSTEPRRTVEVYADLACPWCRLGTHRFHRAVAAAGGDVSLVHLPYQLAPDSPDAPTPLVAAMEGMFGRERTEMMTKGMTELGAAEGLEYRFDRAISVNTFTAHRLLWFALREEGAAAQAALSTALYDGHFRDGANLADHSYLAHAASEAGVRGAAEFLSSDEGAPEVREQVAAARTEGVTSVPTFVFANGERLSGAAETGTLVAALRRAQA